MAIDPCTRFTHRGCLVRTVIEDAPNGSQWEHIVLEAPGVKLETHSNENRKYSRRATLPIAD